MYQTCTKLCEISDIFKASENSWFLFSKSCQFEKQEKAENNFASSFFYAHSQRGIYHVDDYGDSDDDGDGDGDDDEEENEDDEEDVTDETDPQFMEKKSPLF